MRRKVAVRCVNVVWRTPGLSLGIRSAHSTQANPGALTPRQSKSLDEATLFDEGLFRHKILTCINVSISELEGHHMDKDLGVALPDSYTVTETELHDRENYLLRKENELLRKELLLREWEERLKKEEQHR